MKNQIPPLVPNDMDVNAQLTLLTDTVNTLIHIIAEQDAEIETLKQKAPKK